MEVPLGKFYLGLQRKCLFAGCIPMLAHASLAEAEAAV